MRAQDFYQLLRPGLQLLRPPKKSAAAQATVGGLVPYNADAFVAEFAVQPSQVRWEATYIMPQVPGVYLLGRRPFLLRMPRRDTKSGSSSSISSGYKAKTLGMDEHLSPHHQV